MSLVELTIFCLPQINVPWFQRDFLILWHVRMAVSYLPFPKSPRRMQACMNVMLQMPWALQLVPAPLLWHVRINKGFLKIPLPPPESILVFLPYIYSCCSCPSVHSLFKTHLEQVFLGDQALQKFHKNTETQSWCCGGQQTLRRPAHTHWNAR